MQLIITGVIQVGSDLSNGSPLTARWETINPPNGSTEEILYRLNNDGTMNGERTFDRSNATGTEEAFLVELDG